MPRPPEKLLPELLVDRLGAIRGNTLLSDLLKSFVQRPTTFRVNTLKATPQDAKDSLERARLRVRQVSWCKEAFILIDEGARALQKTTLYETGTIYLQSLASMVPPLVLEPKPGESVLDLTAAPGGKTAQIAAMMRRTGRLLAIESDSIRFQRLQHNMRLQGVQSSDDDDFITLINGDGASYCAQSDSQFDRILLDAPCSAEARIIAQDRKTFGYWNLNAVKEMAAKQKRLLLAAWPRLKPGGTLVYSTCTFAPEENELQIAKLLEKFPNECVVLDARTLPLRYLPPVTSWEERRIPKEISRCARIHPNGEIEGFFIAKLQKS